MTRLSAVVFIQQIATPLLVLESGTSIGISKGQLCSRTGIVGGTVDSLLTGAHIPSVGALGTGWLSAFSRLGLTQLGIDLPVTYVIIIERCLEIFVFFCGVVYKT